jgi:hypothetical protein
MIRECDKKENRQIREGIDSTCRFRTAQNDFSANRGDSSLDDQALDDVYYGFPFPLTEAA